MREHLGSWGPLQAPVSQTWDIKGYSGLENALRSEPVAHTAFFKGKPHLPDFPVGEDMHLDESHTLQGHGLHPVIYSR